MVQSVRSRSVWIGPGLMIDFSFGPLLLPWPLGPHRHSSMSIVDELIFGLVLLRQDRFLFFPGEQIFLSLCEGEGRTVSHGGGSSTTTISITMATTVRRFLICRQPPMSVIVFFYFGILSTLILLEGPAFANVVPGMAPSQGFPLFRT